jgi:hypothetical protein
VQANTALKGGSFYWDEWMHELMDELMDEKMDR